MKKLFFILLIEFCILNHMDAGIRMIKVNCPHVSSESPIHANQCIQEVNDAVQFCLFLQRSADDELNNFMKNNIYIKISINEEIDSLIKLSQFDKNTANGIIEYSHMYETNTTVNSTDFILKIEVLVNVTLFLVDQSQGPQYIPIFENSGFYTIEDGSTSNILSVFTSPITICTQTINDNTIVNTTDICDNDGGFEPLAKLSNTNGSNKGSITKSFNKEQINLYPNPFNNILNVNIVKEESESVTIILYDAQGKLIRQLNKEASSLFMTNVKIETSNLPIGVYVCEVITEKERKNFKLLKTN